MMDLSRAMRLQRGGEDLVAGEGFLRGRAAEAVSQISFALFQVGRPHLLDDVGEAGREVPAGERFEAAANAEFGEFPPLLLAALESFLSKGRENFSSQPGG